MCAQKPPQLKTLLINKYIKLIGREPWYSGYGKRLTFQRSWVRFLAPYTRWTFFTFICCKNCKVCLKWPKINEKEAGVGHFFKKKEKSILSNWDASVWPHWSTFKSIGNTFSHVSCPTFLIKAKSVLTFQFESLSLGILNWGMQNCQTNLEFFLHALSLLFWHFINTTAYCSWQWLWLSW